MRKALLIITITAQILVPFCIVGAGSYERDTILKNGTEYNLAVEYVYFNGESISFSLKRNMMNWKQGRYLPLYTDENGVTYVKGEARDSPPANGQYFIEDYYYELNSYPVPKELREKITANEQSLNVLFDFYSDIKSEAPPRHTVTVTAKIYKGKGICTGILIDGERLEEFLEDYTGK